MSIDFQLVRYRHIVSDILTHLTSPKKLSFIFRDYDKMKEYAEKYFRYDMVSWSLMYVHSAHTFIGGLISFWVYRESKDTAWEKRGHTATLQMKQWADSCQWNFQSKMCLLLAEEAFCRNETEKAKSLYEQAISTASEHR